MIDQVARSAATGPANDNAAKLKSAAQAFEAVFLRQMIGAMRSASLDDGMLDSAASDQFRDMSDARLADSMSGKGQFGVAELLVKQLSPAAVISTEAARTETK